MASTASALEVVKAHMEAEDRQDIEATLATFTEDCYYQVPGLGIDLRGKDEIRRWYEETFAAVPDFRNATSGTTRAGATSSSRPTSRAHTSGPGRDGLRRDAFLSCPILVRIPIAADGLMEAEIVHFDNAATSSCSSGSCPGREARQERVMQALHRRLRMRMPRACAKPCSLHIGARG